MKDNFTTRMDIIEQKLDKLQFTAEIFIQKFEALIKARRVRAQQLQDHEISITKLESARHT